MLQLKDIHFSVNDEDSKEKEILNGVNFELGDNQLVAITGPNGSGKSTLAKLIMGLEQASEGRVIWEGEDITELPIDERAKRGIGFAFQQPVKFKGLLIRDLLRIAAGRELTLDDACGFLTKVGLCAADYVNRELNDSLSGGELKRIEIAMLLARKAKLSIFDEPEAGIDLWSFQHLIEVFKVLQNETHGSILIISHQERILEIADRILMMEDGCIIREGNWEELKSYLACPNQLCEFNRKQVLL